MLQTQLQVVRGAGVQAAGMATGAAIYELLMELRWGQARLRGAAAAHDGSSAAANQ